MSANPANPVDIADVSFAYDGSAVLEDVNLSIAPGEFFGIIGPNAAGKTTLLRLMLGLIQPQHGTVRLFGEAAAASRHRVGYVPQHPTFSRRFPISALE